MKPDSINLKPKVSSSKKTTKYITGASIIALAVILAQGFFNHGQSENKKTSSQTDEVSVADSSAAPLNFTDTLPPAAAPQPLPINKTPPPPPPPRSILQLSEMTPAGPNINDENRLKSPTQVYSLEKSQNSATPLAVGGDSNNRFADQAANAQVITVNAKRDTQMDYKILQGKFITAVLETSIHSDLPGMVRAVVSKDIYSDTGRMVLLPRGTRLIGVYNSGLVVGQTRVMVVWTRAITPQHVDIALGSPNADSLGQAGMGGQVDNHFWQIFGSSALLSVLGAAASNINPGSSSGDAGVNGNPYQLAVAQGMMNASTNVLQGRINIQPTIHVAQGSPIDVFVARDLDFSTVMQGPNRS